ncbi:heme exporter protein CcmD [Vibrio sp. SM6]|uniref:Heme exporter protein D n=1 Tax=Vibrio agarilyticus TaxID=2726741 RepID=A0A7X8YHA5_9VIBR|nr:heme exporter protein CcmD [Vibrio agarilyticus]NLS13256.1 heme exporter protein CcmD [Vibrio agarilyticus]
MHFDTFNDFLAMGGYGPYVWSAFAITYGAMLILWVSSVRRSRQLLNEVKAKIARQARIDAAKKMENTL